MFLGHFAVGFAAKRAAPETSLGVLLGGALLLDLLWPIFLLLGWEQVAIEPGNTAFTPLAFTSYPISHSLLAVLGWSVAAGAIYWSARRYPPGALIVGALVLSHWLLDAITHRPDLPLYFTGGPRVGLGLWHSVPGTVLLEGVLFAAGVAIYVFGTRARDRFGRWALAALVLLLLLIYASNIAGPPPPNVMTLAIVALAAWLFPLWGAWIDRHRRLERGT